MHIILKPQGILHALEYYYNLHFKPPRTGEEVHLLGPRQPTPVRCTRSPHLLSDVVLAWMGNFNGPTGSRVLQQTPLKPAGLQGRGMDQSHTSPRKYITVHKALGYLHQELGIWHRKPASTSLLVQSQQLRTPHMPFPPQCFSLSERCQIFLSENCLADTFILLLSLRFYSLIC